MKTHLQKLLGLLMLSVALPLWAASDPTEQIRETVDSILAVLQNSQFSAIEKREQVESLVLKRFDFKVMSKYTLATNWKKATAQQQEQFQELFAQLLRNTYLNRIDAYSNEKVIYQRQRIKNNKAEVDTLVVSGNSEIPIRYRLYLKGDLWLTYDVIIEEVSLVNNYRTNYKSIISKDGIDGLLIQMSEKVKGQLNSADAS